jgi:NAD(P)H-hydrate repair Nnr-like enzyme with NAD(P)H-hydrate dehydratase domain
MSTPPPETIQELSDRLLLAVGYAMGALSRLPRTPRPSMRDDDLRMAEEFRLLVPGLRALLVVATQHADEFDRLCAEETKGAVAETAADEGAAAAPAAQKTEPYG